MFDTHVHAAPDLWPRIAGDARIVRWYAEAGFTGCVLKGHYESTVGRAVAAGQELGLRVFGGQVLNQHAGGINAAAVATALTMGARVIWMPTSDAHTQRTAGLPRLGDQREAFADTVYAVPPVQTGTGSEVRRIVELIADADAVLATGHLSAPEIAWLLPVARQAGVRRLLMTHPSYTVPAMSAAHTAELARQHGALAEVTAFQLLHQPGCDAATLAEFIREVGYRHVVLASDAGQPDSPPPPQALLQLIDVLVGEGLDRAALTDCASAIPERLVVP